MGQATRHVGAPYQAGETLTASNLETDIANVYSQVNGSLDDTNVKSGANLSGAKLADATVTKAKLAQEAVPLCFSSVVAQTGTTMTNATTFQDVPGVTAATLTPRAAGDMIELDFICTVQATDTFGTSHYFGFSVGGVDQTPVVYVLIPEMTNTNVQQSVPVTAIWSATATAPTAIVLKPRYKSTAAGRRGIFPSGVNMVFRARVIPQK